MINEQLYSYLKSQGYSLGDIAEKTGYNYSHVGEILNGTTPFTDAARFRFIKAYPETVAFLMPSMNPDPDDWQPGSDKRNWHDEESRLEAIIG